LRIVRRLWDARRGSHVGATGAKDACSLLDCRGRIHMLERLE
jgi:hypothetical protein